jgi:hypothetical protein
VSRFPFLFPAAGRTLSAAARAAYGLAVGQLGRPSSVQVSSSSAVLIWARDGRTAAQLVLRRDHGTGLWQLGETR